MNKKRIFTLILSILAITGAAFAEDPVIGKQTIRIEGRKTAIVNQANVRLSDIAEISSPSMQDDDSIIGLQKIRIDAAPKPGEELTISASRILERLKEEGVKLSEVVYVLPRVVSVSRASRVLSLSEIEEALRDALKARGKEVSVKKINYNNDIKVSPAFGQLKASVSETNRAGQLGFSLSGDVNGEEDQKFNLTAQIDEWVNIPIAGHYLQKGNKISQNDIVMARMNVANLPLDTFHTAEDIVGKEVSNDIQYGESFRKNKINVPAAVLAGAKVILSYKVGALEATATGISLEAGVLGQEIKVKNESSKKIIVGKILEPGKVGVNP